MEFWINTHSVLGKPMVEAWKDGVLIACIYGHDDGMRIVSKFLDGVEHEPVTPPAVVIKFTR